MGVTCEFDIGSAARLTCRCVNVLLQAFRGCTCHVPRAADRPRIGTIGVPADRPVDWCHPRPDRTSRSGAIHQSAWTYILTDTQTPSAQLFSTDPPEEIFVH